MMPLLLSDFTPVKFGFYMEHVKGPLNAGFKNVFLFSQIFFYFPFKLLQFVVCIM